jgi:hypothetical protein
MPKISTHPPILDSVKQIKISDFEMKRGIKTSGVLKFISSGEVVGSIGYTLYLNIEYPYLNLFYNVDGESINYNVSISEKPSNLGIGRIYYFLCPYTQKPCRKLYLVGKKFLHRTANKRCCYASQIESKFAREIKYTFGGLFETDKAYEQIYSKHFKKYYKEKPTKRYLKLLKIIDKANRIDRSLFHSLLRNVTR